MRIKVLIILVLVNYSCNFSVKQSKEVSGQNNTGQVNCKEDIIFPKSKNLKNLKSKKGDSILFSLTYKKDTCYSSEGIKFQKINIILKSKDYLDSYFCLGIKKDSLFVGEFYDSKINDILFLFSVKDYNYPRKVKNTFLSPLKLDIINIYEQDNEKIFEIESFYEMPHDEPPRYTFDKFYISKERGIFRVDVMENKTNEIYSSFSL
ncbi:hypothetical protein [Aequorivita sp. CIP111184]|uniref:hypothetical protein n=1 Tax=Aequorivita sp. CIP111184 TaxID=2211356 RepID=UPI000DBC19DD|nr:hypothetical protein [Aequorivita sp. CIP111184]SRX52250.1 hypothetical protein AEQU1_00113 [Aequorivita sp. CIP111184]